MLVIKWACDLGNLGMVEICGEAKIPVAHHGAFQQAVEEAAHFLSINAAFA